MERRWQPVATRGNGFGLFSAFFEQLHLRSVATGCATGLHKGSIPSKAGLARDFGPGGFIVRLGT
jgi:hypothetical protein